VARNGRYGCMGDLGLHVCNMPFRAGWTPRTVRAVLAKLVCQRPAGQGAGFSWARLLVAVLPALALILALGVGYLKWLDGTARESRAAAEQSVRAASDRKPATRI